MKKKILIGGLIIVLIAGFVSVNLLRNKSGSAPVFKSGKTYSVKVKNIEKGDISSYVSASGTTEETEKAEVFFDTPLKVKKLLVENNQKVTKGQKLLELDLDSMYTQLEELKITKATQELGADTTAVESEVIRAQSALRTAERTYNDAKKDYEDSKVLYDSEAISKSELDQAKKALVNAEAALSDARIELNTALKNRDISSKTKDQSIKSTDLKIAELERNIQKINESVTSPIDGVLAEVNVTEGGFTSNLEAAFKIVNTSKLEVKAKIKEYDVKTVTVGQNVKITGDAIDKEKEVTGKVISVSPVAKNNTTSSGEEVVVEVVVAIEKSDVELKPGLSVTCDVYTTEKKGVLIAPMEMVKEDKDGNKFAFVVDNSTKTMKEKPVKLGVSSDMNIEVLEGLNEGDIVVLDPQPMFKDGDNVRIMENGIK